MFKLSWTAMYLYHEAIPAGYVITQDPVGDTAVDIGTTVNIVVSSGWLMVPHVVGLTQTQAQATIVAIGGLFVGDVTSQYSDTVPTGIVISQSPDSGTVVPPGSFVDIVVSAGRPIVPNVVGQIEADAVVAVEAIDNLIAVVNYQYDDSIAAGLVISQAPAGGTMVDTGTSVTLAVSLGRPIVPDVVGQAEAAAVAAIETVDNLTATVTYEYHNTVSAGNVISQSPVGATAVNIGTAVSIVISLGRPVVPDVLAQAEADAVVAIEAVDNLTATGTYEYHNTAASGDVISQDPAGATAVNIGTMVNIVISLGRPVVPDVLGQPEAAAVAAIETVDNLTATTAYEYHNTVSAGNVISQDPAGATAVDIGTAVNIIVSLGRPVVPDVLGQTEADAVAAIEAVDNLTTAVTYEFHNTVQTGDVISQNPAGTTAVNIGTTVDIVVSLGQPVVPDVLGQAEAAAVTAIEAVDNLTATVSYEHDNTVPASHVVSQSPAGATAVNIGTTVDVVVSLGRPVVPEVVGQPETTAVAAIEAVDNLTAEVTYEYHNTVENGEVVSQNPAGATVVNVGTVVSLVVSLGRPVVPDIVGQAEAAATSTIEAVDNLTVSVSYEYDNTVPIGNVVGQDPVGSTLVDVGTTISIVVSLGRPIVPEVVGQTESEAQAAITAIDNLTVVTNYEYHNTITASDVISQDPAGGTAVNIGTTVNLVVSLGRPVVPNVIGMVQAAAVSTIEGIDNLTAAVSYEYHNTTATGNVISQDPSGATPVDVGATVSIVISLGRPVVPLVVGHFVNDARTTIGAVDNLTTVTAFQYHNTVPAGYVISQDPAGGSEVDVGTTVDLLASLGRPIVPDVTSQPEAAAVGTIEAVDNLTVATAYEYHNTVATGNVISQNPTGGTAVDIGETVDILVSLGRPVVPNVIGQFETSAVAAIEAVDNLTATIAYEYHNSMAPGNVISQQPSGGDDVDVGTIVNITISLGRPLAPDIVGQAEADAITTIEAVDNLTALVGYEYHNTAPAGSVISQDPQAWTYVDVGTLVNIIVSLGRPVVPNVIMQTEPDAVSQIEAVGNFVAAVTYEYSDFFAADRVFSQQPIGGTEVDVGTLVSIVVSLGRPVVPDVVGQAEGDAATTIEAIDNLTVTTATYQYHDAIPAGHVISQDPVAGTQVNIGATVNIVVSLGRPVVPYVAGMTQAQAEAAIGAVYSLVVGNVTSFYSDAIAAGKVMGQNPPGGTAVPIGSSVDLVISLGRPVVPDVIGQNEAAATAMIESIDNLTAAADYEYSATIPAGNVIGQNPDAGTEVNVGTTVNIVVSLGRPIVPDVIGQMKNDAIAAIEAVDNLSVSITYKYHNTLSPGIVISQDPAGGAMVDIGGTVELVVSLGQPSEIVLGGYRLVELQNDDGGWDWPLDDGDADSGSDPYLFASSAIGLIEAYRHNRQASDPNMLAALQKVRTFLLNKDYNFVGADGALAVELDNILGGTACVDHVMTNFYDKLEAGTYYDAQSGIVDAYTSWYIQTQRDRYSGAFANLAAWELGNALYGAYMIGVDTTEWLAGLRAEIDELSSQTSSYDVLGLAGAVFGLAVTGEDYDPQAGEHAAASNLGDLVEILATYQLGTGGFTWYSLYMEENQDETLQETVYALMAFEAFDRIGYAEQIDNAAGYLQSVQLVTGGWENYTGSGENNEITGESVRGVAAVVSTLGDFDGSGSVNFGDFAIFASAWLSSQGDARFNSDLDISIPPDSFIDEQDLEVFVDNWLIGAR